MALARGGHRAVGFLGLRQRAGCTGQAALNINALMTVAVTGAFLIGQWPSGDGDGPIRDCGSHRGPRQWIGRAAPSKTCWRSRRSKLKCVKTMAVGCAWESGSHCGHDVRIRPGERVPLDGIVSPGQSADQSRDRRKLAGGQEPRR